MRYTALILCGLLCAGSVQAAQMYRWIDAEGNMHFTQEPPPKNAAETKTIAPPPPSGITGEVAVEGQTPDAGQDDETKPEEDKTMTQEQVLAHNCEIAKTDLALLTNNPRVSLRGPDGKFEKASEEQRQAAIERARRNAEAFCAAVPEPTE